MKNKVLITGCSSGFGKEMVSIFLDAGWHVIATMRNINKADKDFEALVKQYPKDLELQTLDVCSAEQRRKIAAMLENTDQQKLDCLINNAGYGEFGPLELTAEKNLRQQFEVNFFGAALLIQDLLPYLRKARGKILNVSSVFGFMGFPMAGAYASSKFALEGLSESLALELAPHGVQVAIIEPGSHRTSFGRNSVLVDENLSGTVQARAVYATQMREFAGLRSWLMNRPSAPGCGVATTALKLANASKIPMRVRVGRDAHISWRSKRLMPSSLFFRILGNNLKYAVRRAQSKLALAETAR